MPIWQALLLGLIQGLAEFLPISSSGHLALAQLLFGLEDGMLLFDVALHIGTLAAVFVVFWGDIKALVSSGVALFQPSRRREAAKRPHTRLILLIVIALLPLLVGILFKGKIEELMSNALYIGIALVVTAIVIKLTDYIKPGKKNERSASVTDAVVVGVMQAAALTPGLSRSGMTISGGLLRGFDRDFAFRFSFLLSIPAILGATLLEVVDAVQEGFDMALLLPMLLGAAVAAITGYIALLLLRKVLISKRFSWFAWYCLAAGAVTIVLALVKNS